MPSVITRRLRDRSISPDNEQFSVLFVGEIRRYNSSLKEIIGIPNVMVLRLPSLTACVRFALTGGVKIGLTACGRWALTGGINDLQILP